MKRGCLLVGAGGRGGPREGGCMLRLHSGSAVVSHLGKLLFEALLELRVRNLDGLPDNFKYLVFLSCIEVLGLVGLLPRIALQCAQPLGELVAGDDGGLFLEVLLHIDHAGLQLKDHLLVLHGLGKFFVFAGVGGRMDTGRALGPRGHSSLLRGVEVISHGVVQGL